MSAPRPRFISWLGSLLAGPPPRLMPPTSRGVCASLFLSLALAAPLLSCDKWSLRCPINRFTFLCTRLMLCAICSARAARSAATLGEGSMKRHTQPPATAMTPRQHALMVVRGTPVRLAASTPDAKVALTLPLAMSICWMPFLL